MADSATLESHDRLVRDSWFRCENYGLTEHSTPSFHRVPEPRMRELLQEQRSLVQTTQREVLPYYENILSNSNCLILLADSQGQLLHSWGDRRFVEAGLREGFVPGASWVERDCGTNAIGTALASRQAVHIHRDEHFLRANRCLSGAASPIFDAARQLIGVLDVSSDSYLPPSHTLGMVRMMSQSVENRLILNLFEDRYFQLIFNTGQDNLDSQWAGLLILDETGQIVSANRRADSLLGIGLSRLNVERLFDVPLAQLLDQPEDRTVLLRTPGRQRFHGIIRRPRKPSLQPENLRKATSPAPLTELSSLHQGDPRMCKAIRQAQCMLEKDIPILIHGETGVGKEVLVKALHAASSRAGAPLIAVNCAAIPAELIESELFGYEKGAFTGAHHRGSSGLIRKADKGILFLDEIGDMPANLQARLLRVLQDRCVQPLGSGEPYPVDFRLICATNRSLRQEIENGRFRQDLFYRVSGLDVRLPPLRERTDKTQLFQSIWTRHREAHQQAGISGEVLRLFQQHPWPGNLRQLNSVIQVALALAGDQPIGTEHLPDDFFADLAPAERPMARVLPMPPSHGFAQRTEHSAARLSSDALAKLLAASGGNISQLARQLGISRNTLYKRLRASSQH